MQMKAMVIDEHNKEAIIAFKYENEAKSKLSYYELSRFVKD